MPLVGYPFIQTISSITRLHFVQLVFNVFDVLTRVCLR